MWQDWDQGEEEHTAVFCRLVRLCEVLHLAMDWFCINIIIIFGGQHTRTFTNENDTQVFSYGIPFVP